MYKRLSSKEIRLKQERWFHVPLFCSFSRSLDLISDRFNDLSAVEFWEEAGNVYTTLVTSARPDLLVYGINRELVSRYEVFVETNGSDCQRSRDMARQSAAIVLTCVAYMLSTPKMVEGYLKDCLHAILKLVSGNAMFERLFYGQRCAEIEEESKGNTIPEEVYLNPTGTLSDNTPTVYGKDALECVPENLRSCIANDEMFPVFISCVRNGILQFITSKEGTAQMWKVVLDIAIERGYIARGCRINRFSELLTAICPEAGEAKKIAQNAYHYSEIRRNYDNDYSCLIKYFPEDSNCL